MNLCIFIVVVCGVSATATASAASMREKLHSLSSLLIELQDKPTQDDVDRLADLAPKLQVAAQLALQERDEHDMTRLHHAVVQQDIPRLNTLLRLGLDIEAASGPMGVRPIHMSVLAEQTGCLERLLEAGASPDAPDAHGTTPLHAASTLNLPHVAEILLDSGASPEARGPKGARPLQLAAWSNAAEAAEMLLARGRARPNAHDRKRRTACHAAAMADAAETLEVLSPHLPLWRRLPCHALLTLLPLVPPGRFSSRVAPTLRGSIRARAHRCTTPCARANAPTPIARRRARCVSSSTRARCATRRTITGAHLSTWPRSTIASLLSRCSSMMAPSQTVSVARGARR